MTSPVSKQYNITVPFDSLRLLYAFRSSHIKNNTCSVPIFMKKKWSDVRDGIKKFVH